TGRCGTRVSSPPLTGCRHGPSPESGSSWPAPTCSRQAIAMHLYTSNFAQVTPTKPWRGITVSVVMMLAIATAAWEIYCRSLAYGPSLNDTGDLWTEARRRVQPESLVIVGDSRALFDSDLAELEKGLGKRPVQLAQPGST